MSFIRNIVVAGGLVMAALAWAQDRIRVLKGEIKDLAPGEERGLVVELESLERRGVRERALIHNDGGFEFRDVATGSYFARILPEIGGDPVTETLVNVTAETGPLELRMPPRPNVWQAGSGVVSVRQLQVPRKAVQALVKAQKLSESGNTEKAVEQLRLAIRLHPDFADAHSNLGVQHVRAGNYVEAWAEFRLAVELKPDSAMARTNLAYALAAMQRMGEAESELRRALAMDGKYSRAHYLLAHVLSVSPGKQVEMVEHLCVAAAEVAAARRDLERMGTRCGAGVK